jgi:Na+/proline symporter
MQGGMKAVVWTDFLQGVVMVVSSVALVIMGFVHVGGFSALWERSRDGGRIRVFE